MKNLKLFSILLLFFSNNLFSQTCLPDGITFSTQAEVDAFPNNYPNCSEILGNVIITGSVNNLNGLSQITSLNSQLRIIDSELVTLEGLNNINTIAVYLYIENNQNLINLDGLESLTFVRNLFISKNYKLSNLDGLNNLETIQGSFFMGNMDIVVEGYEQFNDLTGLESLRTIGGFLSLQNLENLTSLSGIENMELLGSSLSIARCHNLESLKGLEWLTQINNLLSIFNNIGLKNLNGLENLEMVGGPFQLAQNFALEDISALNNLHTISEDLQVSFLNKITSLDDFSNLVNVKEIEIWNNPLMESITGLGNVNISNLELLTIRNNQILASCDEPFVCEYLSNGGASEIFSNPDGCGNPDQIVNTCLSECPFSLFFSSQEEIDNFPNQYPNCNEVLGSVRIEGIINNLDSLSQIISIGEDLRINGCIGLESLEGLNNLSTLNGNLSIFNNPDLVHLYGIENITTVGNSLYVYQNYKLSSLNGLSNLDTILGQLFLGGMDTLIIGYPPFSDLTGLENLKSIGSSFNISNLDYLLNLSGFESLEDLGGNLSVYNCKRLKSFQGLEWLTQFENGISIQSNDSLMSLSGLQNLESIGKDFNIGGNFLLEDISALNNLITIGGDLGIFNSNGFNSLDGLFALTNVNNLTIQNNNSLTSLSGFGNANLTISSNLTLKNNSNLDICNEPFVCAHLENGGLNSIENNASGCNSQNEIEASCGNTEMDCPSNIDEFTTIGEFGNSKYFLSNNISQPLAAQNLAELLGGYLVSINSEEENNFIQQNISEMVYIGLNDFDSEGELAWVNGDPLTYNNINPCSFCDENSEEQDFVIIAPWDGTWSFSNVVNNRKYVIEVPCNSTPISTITIDCPEDIIVVLEEGVTSTFIEFPDATATTTCEESMVSIQQIGDPASGTIFEEGEYTVTFEATDNCGNVESCSFSIIVESNLTSGDCPNEIAEFTTLGEFGESKYYISNDISRPTDAQLVAESLGGYLAVISSQAENDFIQQNISELVYIGLNDFDSEGDFQWVNEESLIFENINPCNFCNENSEDQDFLMIQPWDGGWSFSNFWNQRKYIMEIPCEGNSNNTFITYDCPDDVNIDVVEGTNEGTISYELVAATTTCQQGGVTITLINGPQIGASLPVGTYPVEFSITDECGNMKECQFTVSVIAESEGSCPDKLIGFDYLGEFEGSVYFLSEEVSRPVDAQIIAESNGGNLAIINSQAENDFVANLISQLTYIGLNDFQSEEAINWADGSAVNFTNFDFCNICNENSDDLDFVMMHSWNGGWSWSGQFNQRKYVIEISCESPSGCQCENIVNPVCGSDGVTYPNSCEAECAEIFDYTIGACETISPDCPNGKGWRTLLPNSSYNLLEDISFVNNTGYRVGLNGFIEKSIDAGETWEEQNSPTDKKLFDVDFLTENLGWIVGENVILKTTNGGISWLNQIIPSDTSTFKSVDFVSANSGWMVGDNQIFSTTDGGASWILQHSASGSLNRIVFVDEMNGWAVGQNGIILHTSNGGQDWNLQVSDASSELRGLYFIDANKGWIVGVDGVLMRTIDGGQNWELQLSDPFFAGANNFYHEFNDVFFIDENQGWAIGFRFIGGSNTLILKTDDGGITWNPFELDKRIRFFALSFIDDNTGYAVGEGGTVLKTSDGQTWDAVERELDLNSINSVHFVDENEGWAVGFANSSTLSEIIHTTDGGETWEPQHYPSSSILNRIFFVDNNYGWAVGRQGLIIKTTTGGDTWNTQNSGITSTLRDVFFLNQNEGWSIGRDEVLRTTDGGNTWTVQDISEGSNFRIYTKVIFLDENNGYIIGYDLGGILLKTTDGGENWERIELEIDDANGIHFINPNEGWIVGRNGEQGVLHTTDGGQSFEPQIIDDIAFLTDILILPDGETGWATTNSGNIYTTENGGEDWLRRRDLVEINNNYNITDIFRLDDNNIWIAGISGVGTNLPKISKYDNNIEPVNSSFNFLGEYNDHEYYKSKDRARWDVAQSYAEAIGGHLVVINDQSENDFIQQNISELTHIGISDYLEEENLEWINQEIFDFLNFSICSFCNDNSLMFNSGVIHPWNGKWSFGEISNEREYIVEVPCTPETNSISIAGSNSSSEKENKLKESSNRLIFQKIHPNPGMDYIYTTITSPKNQDVDLQIFNLNGNLVKSIQMNLVQGKNVNRISIAELPSGFYSIYLPQLKGKNIAKRFVKIRE